MFKAVLFVIAKNWTPKCPSTGKWINKLQYIHTYNGIFLSTIKEWTLDTCNNMYESQKHDAKRNKASSKGYIWHNYNTFIWHSRKKKTVRTEIRSVAVRRCGWEKGLDYKAAQGNFLEWLKYSIFWWGWWLYDCVHLSKFLKLRA